LTLIALRFERRSAGNVIGYRQLIGLSATWSG